MNKQHKEGIMKFKSSMAARLPLVAIILAIFITPINTNAAPGDNSLCNFFTGAAHGLCQAAIAVGCDGTANEPAGCAAIADNFTTITGETPFWTDPCPCGSASDFITLLTPREGDFICGGKLSGFEIIIRNLQSGPFKLVWSALPGSPVDQVCGIDDMPLFNINGEEAASCALEIEAAADAFGLSCDPCSPPNCDPV